MALEYSSEDPRATRAVPKVEMPESKTTPMEDYFIGVLDDYATVHALISKYVGPNHPILAHLELMRIAISTELNYVRSKK